MTFRTILKTTFNLSFIFITVLWPFFMYFGVFFGYFLSMNELQGIYFDPGHFFENMNFRSSIKKYFMKLFTSNLYLGAI